MRSNCLVALLALLVVALAATGCQVNPDQDPLGGPDAGLSDALSGFGEGGGERPDIEGTAPAGPNACGGDGPLLHRGEPAELFGPCGDFAEGALVCNGPDALRCSGETAAVNVCGFRGVLPVQVGQDACGPCGDGVWGCGPSEAEPLRCFGYTSANACGGCEPLAVAPGQECLAAGNTEGRYVCEGPNDAACRAGAGNACGGDDPLLWDGREVLPGDACAAACGGGTLRCDGPDALACLGDGLNLPGNVCGGCGLLPGNPGEECGACDDGVWTCAADGSLSCAGASRADACGGCSGNQGVLGATCDPGRVWRCAADGLQCLSPAAPGTTNPCGGNAQLSGMPGQPCGSCAGSVYVCDGPNGLRCDGDDRRNVCGGCPGDGLRGEEDGVCGTCGEGRLACDPDSQVLLCAGDPGEGAYNLCGGCGPLPDGVERGEPCGTCRTWACADGTLRCRPDASLPGCDLPSDPGPSDPGPSGPGSSNPAAPDAPQGVTATEGTRSDGVEVSWSGVPGALGYHVYVNGTRRTQTPVPTTSWLDDQALPGGPPGPVLDLEATRNLADGIRVTWSAASSPAGPEYTYTVRAVGSGGVAGPHSAPATGFLAAEPILRYELRRGGAGAWTDVGDTREILLSDVPQGAIELDAPTATRSNTERVALGIPAARTTPGDDVEVEVRAVNGSGAGQEGESVSGRRATGTVAYQWQWIQTFGQGLRYDFASGGLPSAFSTGGNQGWRIVTDPSGVGGRALQAGAITHNQVSSVSTTVTLEGQGEVAFRYRVSSEGGFDLLEFHVNDERVGQWSGEEGWDLAVFPLGAGTNVLEWRYRKDGSVNRGQDTAWIDEIVIFLGCGADCDGLGWQDLPDATVRPHWDRGIAPGASRWYRMVATAPGATETRSSVVRGIRAGTECEARQTRTCGNCGQQVRGCISGFYTDWSTCGGQGECNAGASRTCGSGGTQTCSSSCSWGTCDGQECSGPSSESCGNCGTRTRTCNNGTWSSWSTCSGQGVCSPGTSQSCGTGGSQTCLSSCSWGTCTGQPCSGPSSESCGNCGTRTRTCNNGTWSSWSTCSGQGVCSPGSTRSCTGGGTQTCTSSCSWGACPPTCSGPSSQTCGNCGTQTRTCNNGTWSSWSTCSGQGVCSPGSTRSCGPGSTQTCTSGCGWGTCVANYRVVANYTSSWSPAGTCNPSSSRAIYQGRATSISGNTANMAFAKCSGAGSPTIDAGRRWWVVVGAAVFPSESDIHAYVTRVNGTVSSGTTVLNISGIPIWPNASELASDPCNSTKNLFIITDGADAPFTRRWFQYRAVTFTKVCD